MLCRFFLLWPFCDLVISDPRLVGRYLFVDFLGSENSFQTKGEIEGKGETTTEANEKEEEEKGRNF